MAVTKPTTYTEILDIEVQVGRSPNEEVLRKMVQNINMLGELAMIGSVNGYAINQSGVSVPSTSVFQTCDGSEITNLDSPLSSEPGFPYYTPDMRNRYIRGANASTVAGNEAGGAASASHAHDHGGVTDTYTDDTYNFATDGEDLLAPAVGATGHNHNISEVTFNFNLTPYYQQVEFYLKIN